MKSKKSKADEIKKCLEKGIPIKDLESRSPIPPQNEFFLTGLPIEPISCESPFPADHTPEELKKNNVRPEQLSAAFFTSGDVAPFSQEIIKFNKRDFNNDCTGLTASGEKKAKNLILNILAKECCSHGFRVSPKAADRKKKNQLILDYVNTFLNAYEFLTENTILSAEEARERLRPYFVKTTVEMYLDEDIE